MPPWAPGDSFSGSRQNLSLIIENAQVDLLRSAANQLKGTYVFKFSTPSGIVHRFRAACDVKQVRDIIAGKLATDPVFDPRSYIEPAACPEPTDFNIFYTDEDRDQVIITCDNDVVDAVDVSRKDGTERVILTIKGGRGWETVSTGEAETKSRAVAAPVLSGEKPPDVPIPDLPPYAPPADSPVMPKSLGEEAPENLRAIVEKLTLVFGNVEKYKHLLNYRDSEAQQLLDVFSTLLDTAGLDARFRRNLLVATQRLSRRAGLYPTCYNLSDIELEDNHPVTAGSFADIYKGRFLHQAVCLKVIRIYQTSQVDSFLKQFSAEAVLWGQLSHPNLIPIYGLYRYNGRLCLVSPWMEWGDITSFLREKPNINRALLIRDVVRGVAYLHENNIVHGGLRGANILVNSSGRACLADVGLSAVSDATILQVTSPLSQTSVGGTVRWQAPELLDASNDKTVVSTKPSDVYAFACVAYEIFTGNIPFFDLTRESAVILRVIKGVLPSRPPESSLSWGPWGLTEHFWSLMQACWSADPNVRPTIHDVSAYCASTSHGDDRVLERVETMSPARFRESVCARSSIPSVDTIDALFAGMDDGHSVAGIRIAPLDEHQHTVAPTEASSELEPPDSVKVIVKRLADVFEDKQQYKRLLRHRGSEAQKLLDTFQMLLGTPGLSVKFRRNLLVATQRLSQDAYLYPTCYHLKNIDFANEHPIAAGSFADIYKGWYLGQAVCLKVIRHYQTSDNDSFLKQLSAEAILWGHLSHPNLLPTYGLFQFTTRLCLVSPWMTYGDVNKFLQEHPDANRTLLVSDVASGVAYLHAHEIIHGDLKGPNILVDASRRARVADFGLAAVSDPHILHWTSHASVESIGGTVRWQAPELFDISRDEVVQNSKPSDVYAFCCVAYEILTGNTPFFELHRDAAVVLKVIQGGRPSRPPAPSPAWGPMGLTEPFWLLMESCWRAKPQERPTIHDIVAHHASKKLVDPRPVENVDVIPPVYFRGTMSALSDPPSLVDVDALLDTRPEVYNST